MKCPTYIHKHSVDVRVAAFVARVGGCQVGKIPVVRQNVVEPVAVSVSRQPGYGAVFIL